MDELDPYSTDDLLTAHRVMTRDLVEESGMFRSGSVGVVDASGNIIHFGSLPQYAPGLVEELLDWVKDSDMHMLIRSCVFHYEFEIIHPFSDGNGRIGCLWHTLLLSKWNPIFAWLPIESMIYEHQDEYYAAINASNAAGESTIFIEFMLNTIISSLVDAIGVSDETDRWGVINQFLVSHPHIMNADVRALFGVSPATANRILSGYAKEGRMVKCREGRYWVYKRK